MKVYLDSATSTAATIDKTVDNVITYKLMVTFTPTLQGHLVNLAYITAHLPTSGGAGTYLKKDGSTSMATTLTLSGNPSTANQASNISYISSAIASAIAGYTLDTAGIHSAVLASPYLVKTGDTIQFPSASPPSGGYLRCSGAILTQSSYPDLYTIIGSRFNSSTTIFTNGQPWYQQYDFNTTQTGDITGWTTGSHLLGSLYDGSAVVTKNRVYLIGGWNDTTPTNIVYTAPINSDGTLGTWGTGIPLDYPIYRSSAIVTSSRVYLLGGISGTGYINVVFCATILTDGTLGGWGPGPSLPVQLADSSVITTSNRVYLLGGANVSGNINTVYTATINTDGTLGSWGTGDPLLVPLSGSSVVVTNARVYLLGGYSGGALVNTVYTAPINSDGTLGSWGTGAPLLHPIYRSPVVVTKNRVYILGGETGSSYANVVYTAPINTDGTLGTWGTGTSLFTYLYGSPVIVTSSKVYLLGGHSLTAPTNAIYSASFVGGFNDYSIVAFGTPSGFFTLPNLSTQDTLTPGIYSYIKI